jgi:hypothetical protein
MKSKLTIQIVLITIAAILLASCSGTATTVSASDGLTTAARLALGTLKVEDTSQALSTAQASELLTLWEAFRSLSNSDTSSQVELDALVKQIEAAMTSEQIKAIEAMDLTDQSVSETLSSLSGMEDGSIAPASTPSASALNQAGPSGGPGGVPSGRDGMSDILGGMTSQNTAGVTQSPTVETAQQVNPMLLNALIQLLETKSQITG